MRIGSALAFLLAVALPLSAQTGEKPFEVSPFLGYLFGGEVYDTPDFRFVVADHLTYGVRVGYHVTSDLEPEVQWSRAETHLRSRSPAGTPDLPLTLDYFLAGIMFNFARDRVRPYASVSAGVARLSPPSSNGESEFVRDETRFAGSVALGVKTFLTSSFGLRFDARGYATRTANARLGFVCTTNSGSPGGPVVPVSAPCPTKDWLVTGELTGGLLLAF
jgi:outer membrane protein with beta-barrel domain